ncbi:unnamed protein product [Caenorhabditis auriculariae]|uniref:Receptor L-domain domain-containing protein n=1 Tax=Caenorhabditis auriculariae TaxID=2777116 RepID=A0A8S1GP43_9PELO|nr:unnamed protein product [Caenorhabditis auriculariae]
MSVRFLFIAIITADTFSVASGVEWCKRPMLCYASGCAVPDECAVSDCQNTEAPIYVENLASEESVHTFLARAIKISTLTVIGNEKLFLPENVIEIIHGGTGPAVTLKNAKFDEDAFKNLEKITVDDPYIYCDVENKLIDIEGVLEPQVKGRLEKVASQTLVMCDKPRPDFDAEFNSLVVSPLESPLNVSEQKNVPSGRKCFKYDAVFYSASVAIGVLLVFCIALLYLCVQIYRAPLPRRSAHSSGQKKSKGTRQGGETGRQSNETGRENDEKASTGSETIPKSSENERIFAEKEPKVDEKEQKIGEKVQINDEKASKSDEKEPKNDQNARKSDETKLDEKVQKNDEKARKSDETARKESKKEQKVDEKVRKISEKIRKSSKKERKSRKTTSSEKKPDLKSKRKGAGSEVLKLKDAVGIGRIYEGKKNVKKEDLC